VINTPSLRAKSGNDQPRITRSEFAGRRTGLRECDRPWTSPPRTLPPICVDAENICNRAVPAHSRSFWRLRRLAKKWLRPAPCPSAGPACLIPASSASRRPARLPVTLAARRAGASTTGPVPVFGLGVMRQEPYLAARAVSRASLENGHQRGHAHGGDTSGEPLRAANGISVCGAQNWLLGTV
jgi:hypothetical protein